MRITRKKITEVNQTAKNWYPQVNKETCSECGKCVAKCAHGVYDKNSPKKPVVVFPDGCVDGCHGGGDLCPTGSITYVGENTKWTPPNRRAGDTSSCCDSDCSCNGEKAEGGSVIKEMSIYEPAMCCPTGLCGPSIDPELLRISAALETLKKNGVEVKRYNLTSFPQEFVKNAEVNKRLADEGVEALPIIMVDGKIVITKRYPKNEEFIKLLGLPSDCLGEGGKAATDESCCAGGKCC